MCQKWQNRFCMTDMSVPGVLGRFSDPCSWNGYMVYGGMSSIVITQMGQLVAAELRMPQPFTTYHASNENERYVLLLGIYMACRRNHYQRFCIVARSSHHAMKCVLYCSLPHRV
jgi:hypothetical protein